MKQKFLNFINNRITLILTLFITIIGLFIPLFYEAYNLSMLSIFLLWFYCCLYSMCNYKENVFILIFLFMIFTFIIDRPLISMIRGDVWWYFDSITIRNVLVCIYVSIVFVFCGGLLGEKFIKDSSIKQKNINFSSNCINFIKIIVLITFIFNFSTELINYFKFKSLDYASIYTGEVVNFPIVVRLLTSLFPYFCISYLAFLPKKKNVIMVAVLLLTSAIPSFLLGSRNLLVLRMLFIFVYIIIRYLLNNGDLKKISKKGICIFVILLVFFVAFLGTYNYIRDNNKISNFNLFSMTVDFFYKQGTTFDTICQGFSYETELKNAKIVSYTFGDIIDYIEHNTISNKLFGTESLGSGNSLLMVNKSNSVAHKLSYYVLGEDMYLKGHGRGTSYIIETYIDGGVLLLAIYSIFIGLFLRSIMFIIKQNKFLLSIICLNTLYNIYLLPRYSASGFVTFLFTIQFWLVPFIIIIINKVLKKVRLCNEK